jgi:hypothetical protein
MILDTEQKSANSEQELSLVHLVWHSEGMQSVVNCYSAQHTGTKV